LHRDDHPLCGDAAHLERVYVLPAVLGRRVGEALIARVLSRAAADRRQGVWLQAMANAARPLERYRQMGFVVCGSARLQQPLVRRDLAAMLVLKKDLTHTTEIV
jgi:GNAT superfamily N-acetyltransferase